ncbi:unnamed protein product [Lathyrus sativus]|nr:unnamed protein product [Lathyrus sativus]
MERKRSSFSNKSMEMREFCEFIVDTNLVDVPITNNKFTWFGEDGLYMSRIDHFLISDGLIHNWGVMGQKLRRRDISDHCHVWIMSNNLDWGPKPFKENLKLLKISLKKWNLEVFGKVNLLL